MVQESSRGRKSRRERTPILVRVLRTSETQITNIAVSIAVTRYSITLTGKPAPKALRTTTVAASADADTKRYISMM